MARLPLPGGDDGRWARLLNEYLLVAHNPDGTPKRKETFGPASGKIGLKDLRAQKPPSGHIKDLTLSNDGTNLVWRKNTTVNVCNYGAVGDGRADDTDAIQAAIDTLPQGGTVLFPRGTYMIRTLSIKANGVQLSGTRFGVRLVRLSGNQPLIDISGASSKSHHIRYCSLFGLTLSGDSMPGALLRTYYADTCVYRDVSFISCVGLALDAVEVWDTRFDNCAWEYCGSPDQPATLFRNSTQLGTFGYSQDNSNQIHFVGCRWEGFCNGALRLEGAANGATTLLNGVCLVGCKMESSLACGPPFQIMPGTTLVQVSQLYIAVMATEPSSTKPIDAIVDYGTHVFMANVYVQWGPTPGLANAAIHVMQGGPHMYREISVYYPTEPPAQAAIAVEPGAHVMVACLWANRGAKVSGDATKMLESNPQDGLALTIKNSGSFRVVSAATGKDLVKADNSSQRPTLHTLNGVDLAGFSGDFEGEKWRFHGDSGFVSLASGKFQIEGTKGYLGIGTAPYTGIAMLVQPIDESDRGLAIIRPSAAATTKLLEFQDEAHHQQGEAFDSHGRPVAVGSPPNVAKGDQTSYANPGVRVQDIAGNITAAVRRDGTRPGTIATVTFSRPYAKAPLFISLADHSAAPGDLYVSSRSANDFTVSTRKALRGGAILNFDYAVIA
jgi:hypothetical protein